MKRLRISRCATQLLGQPAPRRPFCPYAATLHQQNVTPHNHRIQAGLKTTAAVSNDANGEIDVTESSETESTDPTLHPFKSRSRQAPPMQLVTLPSPHPKAANSSTKLHALRSRLSLSSRFPLQSLARTLVHPSADRNPAFNNASLSILGSDLLSYYTTEWIICNYPRLPMSVIFAAQEAYVGPKALATIAREWGIEAAAEPGGEVDPGLLQFQRLPVGDDIPPEIKRVVPWKWNVTTTHKIRATDEFGSDNAPPTPHSLQDQRIPSEEAASSFVRALIGSLHLHLGSPLVKRFFRDHFLSRHLDISSLFDFRTPTRDLSRLCAREGFKQPIARLISETGRLSRHPVFVVGVYSGRDKLGEGTGSSLKEARFRAAAAALKGWYLYRPMDATVPSSTEGKLDTSDWKPNLVDCGEVIV